MAKMESENRQGRRLSNLKKVQKRESLGNNRPEDGHKRMTGKDNGLEAISEGNPQGKGCERREKE